MAIILTELVLGGGSGDLGMLGGRFKVSGHGCCDIWIKKWGAAMDSPSYRMISGQYHVQMRPVTVFVCLELSQE